MSANPHNLQVGQKLWLVPARRGHGNEREVTIKKIGRTWATIDHGDRVSLESFWLDGGNYTAPGRCYLSREQWEDEKYLDTLWDTFHKGIRTLYTRPKHLTAADINNLMRLAFGGHEGTP